MDNVTIPIIAGNTIEIGDAVRLDPFGSGTYSQPLNYERVYWDAIALQDLGPGEQGYAVVYGPIQLPAPFAPVNVGDLIFLDADSGKLTNEELQQTFSGANLVGTAMTPAVTIGDFFTMFIERAPIEIPLFIEGTLAVSKGKHRLNDALVNGSTVAVRWHGSMVFGQKLLGLAEGPHVRIYYTTDVTETGKFFYVRVNWSATTVRISGIYPSSDFSLLQFQLPAPGTAYERKMFIQDLGWTSDLCHNALVSIELERTGGDALDTSTGKLIVEPNIFLIG